MAEARVATLAEVEELLGRVRLQTAYHAEEAEQSKRGALEVLRTKLAVASAARPLVVVVAGGTNVGKSTVFNLLVGEAVSAVSALARGTKTPVLCGGGATLSGLPAFLPGVETVRAAGIVGSEAFDHPAVIAVEAAFPPEGCLLIDSPDMDSDHAPNRAWAMRLLHAADGVVLVTTPEKYHDAVVADFLRSAAALGRTLAAVMNKADSAEALRDFVDAVWRPIAGAAPTLAIPRSISLSHEADSYRDLIREWNVGAPRIKGRALAGSTRALRAHLHHLAKLADEERRWLTDLHRGIDAAVDDAARLYRRRLAGERFEELDLVFRRLLREFRIPVLDDFYDGVRTIGAAFTKGARRVLGGGDGPLATARQERHRHLIADVCGAFAVDVGRLIEGVPSQLKATAAQWRETLPPFPDERHVDAYVAETKGDVERWVAEESAIIARTIGAHPGLRGFAVAVKSTLQIGAGVAGAILTGGINISDLAVLPLAERLTAFLLERGLGYPYFLRCRARLLDVREAGLRRFLNRRAEPLRRSIPVPDRVMAERLEEAASGLPGVEEMAP